MIYENDLIIVGARKGSKGLKNKNKLLFDGEPMVIRTLNQACRLSNNVIFSTDDEDDNGIERKSFLKDVKGHVKTLSKRDYIDPADGTLDFVLMFIPNEGIYAFLNKPKAGEDNLVEFAMENNLHEDFYNVGSGEEISIKGLAKLIKKITSFNGKIEWDKDKPDGTPRKLIDSTKIINEGWSPKIKLVNGINSTYKWYLKNIK